MSNPRANKDLGQHYLKDKKVIKGISENYNDKASAIVEVGPGPISLTKDLAKNKLPLYVIETDKRFYELLTSCVDENNIFMQDALKFNWNAFTQEQNLNNIWLVSNLPYNISVPLLLSFTKVPQISYMTLMFQKEVGEKTYIRPHIKNQMSSLLMICQNYFHTNPLLKVLPGAFAPPPKVDSVVVSYERKIKPDVSLNEFDQFEKFLRILFQFKRKQIGSSLKTILNSEQINLITENAGVSRTDRAEHLDYESIIKMYRQYQTVS